MFDYLDGRLKPLEKKVVAEERLSFEDGVTLFASPDLLGVGHLANLRREQLNANNTDPIKFPR